MPPPMTEAEMLVEAESIACAEDWDSNNDKIRAIARLVHDYAGTVEENYTGAKQLLEAGKADYRDLLAHSRTAAAIATALGEALADLFAEASELGEHRFTQKSILLARHALRAAGLIAEDAAEPPHE